MNDEPYITSEGVFRCEITIDLKVVPVVTYYSPPEPAVDSEDGGYPGCPAEIEFYLMTENGSAVLDEFIPDKVYEQIEQELLDAIQHKRPVEIEWEIGGGQ